MADGCKNPVVMIVGDGIHGLAVVNIDSIVSYVGDEDNDQFNVYGHMRQLYGSRRLFSVSY